MVKGGPRLSIQRWAAAFVLLASIVAGCRSTAVPADSRGQQGGDTTGGVRYEADLLIMESFPVQLRARVSATNATAGPVTITLPDGCSVLLRAYRDAARSGEPAWDETGTVVCTQAIQQIPVAAGETTWLEGRTIGAAEILGDSLPAGRYYFTALVRPDGQRIELEAGEADLAQ